MATARAIIAPWSSNYKRATKVNARNYDWSMGKTVTSEVKGADGQMHKVTHVNGGGWRSRRYEDEWKHPPKDRHFKELKLYNGKTVQVPDADFEDYIGFQKADDMAPDIQEWLSSINYTQEFAGKEKSHITNIAYSPSRQVLEATFAAGAVVCYFRVPKEVYSELLAVNEHTQIGFDGKPRHLLGIRFWDIIRIRGQQTGSRYKYSYTEMNETSESGGQGDMDVTGGSNETEYKGYKMSDVDLLKGTLKGDDATLFGKLQTVKEKYNLLKKNNLID